MSRAGRVATVAAAVALLSACGVGSGAHTPRANEQGSGSSRICALVEPAGAPIPTFPATGCPTSQPTVASPVPTLSTTAPPPPRTTSPPVGDFPYAWAASDDDPIVVGATFTLVHGMAPRDALKTLVPHPRTPIESPARVQSWIDRHSTNDDSYPQSVEAGSRHGWTMILENNGFRATDRATLRRLSRSGAAVVVYNNVDFLSSFQYAVNGHVLRDFDPLAYADYPPAGRRLPQESGIPFGHGVGAQFISQSLQLAARLVGFKIIPADVTPARYSVAVGTTN